MGGGIAHCISIGALRRIFAPAYRRRTLVNAGLVTVSIVGLWAAAVYEPAAIVAMAKRAGYGAVAATRLASLARACCPWDLPRCLAAPVLAERLGRRWTQRCISWGWRGASR